MITFDKLKEQGYQRLGTLLTEAQCRYLRGLYDNGGHFRSRIDMARYASEEVSISILRIPSLRWSIAYGLRCIEI